MARAMDQSEGCFVSEDIDFSKISAVQSLIKFRLIEFQAVSRLVAPPSKRMRRLQRFHRLIAMEKRPYLDNDTQGEL